MAWGGPGGLQVHHGGACRSAELGFPGRRTRGATDRANQALNYVYGVLYGEVWQAVVSYGLDPYFGVMHGSTQDNGSLVFDLVEELRAPFADRTVAALVGRGFVPRTDRCGGLLGSTRRTLAAAFLRGFTRRRVRRGAQRETGQAILRDQVRSIAALYRERGRYRGYRMQW
ncbi:MAG: CRISPR-associated endonuclease Cas1 [Deltaproteobacteria bacterium HGW-Deltaproteobacteria-14]|jgi:CRISPR-associated protein Cas1|nr:MAG: CRISPR-associated endonuclease Cas1 [Deltaproteobacteria bacterium HGW-Deltaproteobacteria-14]